jgi:archaetidylinositol phosphate synthase
MAQNQAPMQNQNHVRIINSVLGSVEKKVLWWLAARMPSWVVPDTLTALGLFASVLIFLGYALTIYHKGFLWLASLGFILNWFGDSLDGTLARYRKIERPRYGFFVDHIVDAVDEVLIFIGIGISPYVQFEFALFALIVYLLVSIYVYLATYVNGVFRISYGGLGPTETRVLAILANTFVFFTGNPTFQILSFHLTFYDMVALLMIITGTIIFISNSVITANDLSRVDRAVRREKLLQERAARKQERLTRRQEKVNRQMAQRDAYQRRKSSVENTVPTGQLRNP